MGTITLYPPRALRGHLPNFVGEETMLTAS